VPGRWGVPGPALPGVYSQCGAVLPGGYSQPPARARAGPAGAARPLVRIRLQTTAQCSRLIQSTKRYSTYGAQYGIQAAVQWPICTTLLYGNRTGSDKIAYDRIGWHCDSNSERDLLTPQRQSLAYTTQAQQQCNAERSDLSIFGS
jgi:hypothetical protein